MQKLVIYELSTGYIKAMRLFNPDNSADMIATIEQRVIDDGTIGVIYLPANEIRNELSTYKIDVVSKKLINITPEDAAIRDAVKIARSNLKARGMELFEMLLGVWQVGVSKGLWANTDLPQELRDIAIEWKNQLDIIKGA